MRYDMIKSFFLSTSLQSIIILFNFIFIINHPKYNKNKSQKSIINRKCGKVICGDCSRGKELIPYIDERKPVRLFNFDYLFLFNHLFLSQFFFINIHMLVANSLLSFSL